jgi:AraC-like DNA-binding protein
MLLNNLITSLDIKLYALGYAEVGSWWNYKNINSPFTRLLYITSGDAVISFNSTEYQLSSGDLIVIPPFIPINYLCNDTCNHYYILFTAELAAGVELFSYFQDNFKIDAAFEKESLFRRLVTLNPNLSLKLINPKNKNYNNSIFSFGKDSPEKLSDLMECDGIMRILISPFIRNRQKLKSRQELTLDRIMKVLHYIDNNIDKPIFLKDMSAHIAVHPNYFSDLFLKYIGERPIAYLIRKRVEMVQFLLVTTEKSIKEIAISCGFHDTDYFYRVFKKRVGTTPGKYRANQLVGV